MPNVGCDPNTRCETSKRKKKSDLESPKKILKTKWTKKKHAGRKQEPEGGALPTTAPCYLPDIEKANQGENPNHKQLSPDIPMRQPRKCEKNQAREKNSMFVVLGEKVGEPKSAGLRFLKKRCGPIPLIPKWDVDAIPEYEKAD